MADPVASGMSARQAKTIEYAIVAVSVLSLALLFQPFSLTLYSVGAGLVVFAGLAFNLVPLCAPGKPVASLVKAAVIIAVVFVIVAAVSILSVELYAAYLTAS